MECDLLIRNAALLSLEQGSTSLIESGFIGVKDGKIAFIGDMAELPDYKIVGEVLEADGQLAMPGLVNGHCHAAMTLFRGMADDLPLMSWLQEHIFPAEAAFVNPEMVYWCTKLAAAEMLLSGTTTVADGYFHEHDAARAFQDAGIRAIAAQGVIDFPAPGVPDPKQNIATAETFLNDWKDRDARITPAIFCHSPYTCGPETLQKAKELAKRHGVSFYIHVAETKFEVEQCLSEHGKGPIAYLDSLNVLDESTILIHCVWPAEHEMDIIAARASSMVTCPESNMKLASGVAPLAELSKRGVKIGLGTDGCASNNDLDLFGEMDAGAKLQKVHNLEPTSMPADQMLNLATLQGAKALGLGENIGSLEIGKQADIILLNVAQPHLTPFYNADLLVYAARGADVQTVIIDGKFVIWNRRVLSFDVKETMARVSALAKQVSNGK